MKKLLGLLFVGLLTVSAYAGTAQIDTSGVGNNYLTKVLFSGTGNSVLNTAKGAIGVSSANSAAAWSSGQTLFGAETIYINNTGINPAGKDGDCITVGTIGDWDFLHDETISYTLDCWIYQTATRYSGNSDALFSTADWSGSQKGFYTDMYGGIRFWTGNAADKRALINPATPAPTLNVWIHYAVTYDKSASKYYIFRNGALTASHTPVGTYYSGNSQTVLYIGNQSSNSSGGIQAYFSNFRITKGRALYTRNFTPPTRGN